MNQPNPTPESEDAKGHLQDLEAVFQYGITKMREAWTEVMQTAGLDASPLSTEEWLFLENTQLAFWDFEEWERSLEEPVADRKAAYQKEKQEYILMQENAKDVAVKLVEKAPAFLEYERTCDNMGVDPRDFCLTIVHTIMNSVG